MIPGPDRIISCPFCGSLARRESLISANTLGATYYTDGSMLAPMWPQSPAANECSACHRVYLVSEAHDVGVLPNRVHFDTHPLFDDWEPIEAPPTVPAEWDEAPWIELPSEEAVYKELGRRDSADPELSRLRLLAWRTSGIADRDRRAPEPHVVRRSPQWTANVDALLSGLPDPASDHDRLLRAELLRQASRFDACRETLRDVEDERLMIFRERIEGLAVIGDNVVRKARFPAR